jgi:hypothetical protein
MALEPFKQAHARRQRYRVIMMVVAAVAMGALATTRDSTTVLGIPMTVLGPIAFVALVAAWLILDYRNWRCPACNEYLGRPLNPRQCRNCGIELRG